MTLADFKVERIHVNDENGSHDMFEVTCPRKECGQVHWVPTRWAVLQPVSGAGGQVTFTIGRPCPHCSRAALIPQEIRRNRRVVRRARAKR